MRTSMHHLLSEDETVLPSAEDAGGLPARVMNRIKDSHRRPAREDELSAVLRLWQEADVSPPSVTDSIEGLTRLTNAPGGILLVATTDDRIIGSVTGGWDGWRGNIYRLAVTPEYRRRGIARRLVL